MRCALVLLAIGCGGPKTPPGELHPTLEISPPDARHDDASDDVTAVANQLAPLTAVAPKPVIPPQLRNVPLLVEELDGLLLFEDEQAIAAAELAAWAQAAGLVVAEPSRTREQIARAKRGENVVTGKACGAPLRQAQTIARWHTELAARGRLEAHVRCAPECSLFITAAQGLAPTEQGAAAFFVAPYDVTRPWHGELSHAFTQLVDTHEATKPARGSTEPGRPADPAADAPPAPPLFGIELRDHVEHCLAAGEQVGVLVELDPKGVVTRCEGEDHHVVGSLSAAPCVCQGLTKQTFSDAKGRRRGIATFSGKSGVTTTKRGARVHAELSALEGGDPAIAGWALGASVAIEQCFASETDPAPFTAEITVHFDANGAVTAVEPVQKKCVEAAVEALRAPCPVAPTTARARLAVSFDKP